MFDLTERYFQSHIQKFQPSGHNYLISKIRFNSSVLFLMSCDVIWGVEGHCEGALLDGHVLLSGG